MSARGGQETESVVISLGALQDFLERSLQRAGASADHAHILATLMVAADYRGHFSHGLNRLEFYVVDLQMGLVQSGSREPRVVRETSATALVDGNNVLGPVVGRFAMDLAIRKAKEAGIGWVTARGSNHFGIAGWYSMRAMEHGLMGMAFTNSSPTMVPTRGSKKILGTNPISVAAPANNGDSMVLDMATTVVALGKVEVKNTVHQDIPLGWGVDKNGKPTTDPAQVLGGGGLLPLGGAEETSGYKGYGLGMMVDVFCGVLSGATYGQHIRNWFLHDGVANLGHCFVAIDPNAFAPGFTDRMSDLLDFCRNLQPAEGEGEVLVPGDPERNHMARCDALGGIPYDAKQIQWADNLAEKNGVEPLRRAS